MKIEWRNELSTGNCEIDGQHHELFERINDLIAACKERREKDEIVLLMSFLKNYVKNHFSAEESYQALHGFPCRLEHKAQHETLVLRLDILEKFYAEEGITLPVVTNSLMLTYEWLTDHIMKADLEMARFYKADYGQSFS